MATPFDWRPDMATILPLSAFSASMIAGCEAALDAGVFYQDAFKDFVLARMGGFDCEAVLVETIDLTSDAGGFGRRRLAALETVKPLPRGHYVVVRYVSGDGSSLFGAAMSDGSGNIAPGGAHDSYDMMPTGNKLLDRMLGYEIYLCRHAIEDIRRTQTDIEALAAHAFTVGMVFKNYRHPGDGKPYSKAVVCAVSPASGTLKLVLTKRGSAKRWEATVGAKEFAERVQLQAPEPDNHPFAVVVPHGAQQSLGGL